MGCDGRVSVGIRNARSRISGDHDVPSLLEERNESAVGDYAGQAAACVRTMKDALAAAGATLTDVISTRVLVASSEQSDLVAAWEVVRDAFGVHDVPSTLMGVTVLGYDGQLVEIEAVAAVID